MPGPRNVCVTGDYIDSCFEGWVTRPNSAPPPVALQICHESRQEALKYYILSFGTATHPPTIYFNYEIDTLCFGDGIGGTKPSGYWLSIWQGTSCWDMATKAIQENRIKFLTLDVQERDLFYRDDFIWEDICLCDGLEELLLIFWDSDDDMEEHMALLAKTMAEIAKANPQWIIPKVEVVSNSGRAWGSLRVGNPDQDGSS